MTEHAFAPFVRTLGRGKRARRSLTREEARDAMQAILDGQVDSDPEMVRQVVLMTNFSAS